MRARCAMAAAMRAAVATTLAAATSACVAAAVAARARVIARVLAGAAAARLACSRLCVLMAARAAMRDAAACARQGRAWDGTNKVGVGRRARQLMCARNACMGCCMHLCQGQGTVRGLTERYKARCELGAIRTGRDA
ncbi:unnamed protein product [Closterium sp. NIES-54]